MEKEYFRIMEKPYFYLFKEISNLMALLSELQEKLILVQQEAEELYISADFDPEIGSSAS